MTLDILTPKGQQTRREEDEAIQIYLNKFPNRQFFHTPKELSSAVDGLIFEDQSLYGIVETKCRHMTMEKLVEYDMEWLVTFEKILDARKVSDLLMVPLFGMLYLVPDNLILIKKFYHPYVRGGEWKCEFKVKKSLTQATVNGGEAFRDNAFIDMTKAQIIKG